MLSNLHAAHVSDQKESLQFEQIYIIIASDKGLCGSFNNILQAYLQQHISDANLQKNCIITVGKKAYEMIYKRGVTPDFSYNKLTQNKLSHITNALYKHCKSEPGTQKTITALYNYPQNFFTQIPTTQQIFPFAAESLESNQTFDMQTYDWPQPQHEVYAALLDKTLRTSILQTLANSLLAEQSARFVSMDSATKNASGLLKQMRISYNKLRQAKITKELAELASSF